MGVIYSQAVVTIAATESQGPSLGRELAAYGIGDYDLFDRISKWYHEIPYIHYSTRQLTHASDRLPAISGLAKLVQGSMNMTYIAGLWKEGLQYGLCWGVVNIVPRSTVNGPPSWSWASYETPLFWPMSVYRRFPPALFDLNNFHVELASNDEFGRVNRGFLKITGLVSVVQIEFLQGLAHPFDHSILVDKTGDWSSKISDSDGVYLGAALLDRDPGTDVVHALILARAEKQQGRDDEWKMLLITCAGGTGGRFERIGIAQVFCRSIDEKPLWLPKFERRSMTLI
ncbi:hypothetical protein COCVIDRAFT_15616 [Bipolaris victoriae FI3]|uniref:Heterokaryon incompatibility domain-containing protein n=1 Tax=Bipolaris victoriae (strain FI3) TaxID=930091 RepID=W7EAH9_BIPV3|nr:hypothetical protein COCVIDRAFT_15616 [Bipolaris victoriae FI3]